MKTSLCFKKTVVLLGMLISIALPEKTQAQYIVAETNVFGCAGQTSNIYATPNEAYQWEVSTDGGNTWTVITDNAIYSGSTRASLNILSNIGMDLYQYRCSPQISGG